MSPCSCCELPILIGDARKCNNTDHDVGSEMHTMRDKEVCRDNGSGRASPGRPTSRHRWPDQANDHVQAGNTSPLAVHDGNNFVDNVRGVRAVGILDSITNAILANLFSLWSHRAARPRSCSATATPTPETLTEFCVASPLDNDIDLSTQLDSNVLLY